MMMEATNNYLIAIILISAGVYQLTKTVCLEKSPNPPVSLLITKTHG